LGLGKKGLKDEKEGEERERKERVFISFAGGFG
jgi:hypothetical protein